MSVMACWLGWVKTIHIYQQCMNFWKTSRISTIFTENAVENAIDLQSALTDMEELNPIASSSPLSQWTRVILHRYKKIRTQH